MSDFYRIVTPENIELDYEIAGIGSRFLAIAIDFLIQTSLILALYATLFLIYEIDLWDLLKQEGFKEFANSLLGAVVILLALVINLGYFIVLETVLNGQTIGKKIINIRVRKEQGYPPNFWDILLRNLVRPVDFLPSFYTIGILSMFISPRAKRLGDYAAGTIVVKEVAPHKLRQLLDYNAPLDSQLIRRESDNPWIKSLLTRLTQADYLLIKDLLSRAPSLDNISLLARRLLLRLIAPGLTEMPPELANLNAVAVLNEVMLAYEAAHFN